MPIQAVSLERPRDVSVVHLLELLQAIDFLRELLEFHKSLAVIFTDMLEAFLQRRTHFVDLFCSRSNHINLTRKSPQFLLVDRRVHLSRSLRGSSELIEGLFDRRLMFIPFLSEGVQ